MGGYAPSKTEGGKEGKGNDGYDGDERNVDRGFAAGKNPGYIKRLARVPCSIIKLNPLEMQPESWILASAILAGLATEGKKMNRTYSPTKEYISYL